MTTDQWIKQNEKKIELIIKEDKPLKLAVGTIMSLMSKRIFLDAKNADGGIIGTYEGGEVWVSPRGVIKGAKATIPNFELKGKPVTGKKIENRKTGYFKNWLTFKEKVGRNKITKNIDLFLSGTLHMDFANMTSITGVPNAKKQNAHNYFVDLTQLSVDKASKYPRVFNISKTEREAFLKVIQFEFNKAMK